MTQIHRFHDMVALYIGTGATVYLSPSVARKVAKALNGCAKDVGACKFTKSTFSTVEVDDK